MRILLIDNDQLSREGLISGMRDNGITCDDFVDPIEAISAYKKDSHEIVLLDASIKKMTWMEVIKRLQNRNPLVKIFIMNNEICKDRENLAIRLGAMECMLKPQSKADFDQLLNRFESIEKALLSKKQPTQSQNTQSAVPVGKNRG